MVSPHNLMVLSIVLISVRYQTMGTTRKRLQTTRFTMSLAGWLQKLVLPNGWASRSTESMHSSYLKYHKKRATSRCYTHSTVR